MSGTNPLDRLNIASTYGFSAPSLSFGMTPGDTGSIFNQPVMPFNMNNSSLFSPNYGDMFAQNMQESAWKAILGFLSNYKPQQFDMSMFNFDNDNQIGNYSDDDTSYFSYDSKELKEKWQSKKPDLSDKFYNKVVAIAERLNCDPNDLMGVMNSESGIKSDIKNPNGSATGLIQFIGNTAKSLGTSTSALAKMSPEEQLNYVEKYLQKTKLQAGIGKDEKITAGTLYALVFLPARAKRDVLATRGEGNSYYESNTGLDKNKDGMITKDELGHRVQKFKA